ncbi:MAG: FAD-dependent oxidoreductase [Clostridiales bacterium]|nr:FAD-dependent oxidoreductase [Clostridiales bacterium]
MKTVIVGGVAGGASAAARLRRLDEKAEIVLFEKGEFISFANCGLPYYIGGVIKEKEKLVVQTPEAMKERFNLDIRIFSEVISINKEEKYVEVYNSRENTKYRESYDTLVLSPGADPVLPDLPGIKSQKIFTLRNIPDTYRIKDYVDNHKPQRAVVVGAGFIGLEVAENLHQSGVKVTVVELADHVIGPLDYEMASIVHQHLKTKNMEFYLKDSVKAFNDTGAGIIVELSSGRLINVDMVIMGIGVRPETRIASAAGLKLGPTGGILVDDYMRTSDENIYAVGDAVEIRDFVSGMPGLVPLAGPANKQGRIAANNICGRSEKYPGTQGTSIVKVFDITVAITGSNERALKKNGVNYEKSFTHSPSHAGYYPGAIPMSIKLLFGKYDGRILGAQIIGYEGVDKRMDVIATAIRAGMTVHDLEKLELAYAPPYSSAKDPVNIAGFTASNILKGDCRIFHWQDVACADPEKSILLDVRTETEYGLGTIKGALNIPLDELRNRLAELPKDKEILVFCQVGLRGYVAVRLLMQNGFSGVRNLSGGYKTYQLAVEKQSNEDIYQSDKVLKDDTIKAASEKDSEQDIRSISVDACGLQCPGPILETFKAIKEMDDGEILEIKATDPGFQADIKVWCEKTGNKLLDLKFEKNTFIARIKKAQLMPSGMTAAAQNGKTMIVFSGDLDKAIASFIIANGAAAMGRNITMFFTFWGLNILRKPEKVKVGKDFLSKMFGMMMPRGTYKLGLSRMNMGGIGGKLIRYIMKKNNVSSLEELVSQAKANGVRLIACNMSMDIMGIKMEELIDGVEMGGVATMLGSAEESDMSLFI